MLRTRRKSCKTFISAGRNVACKLSTVSGLNCVNENGERHIKVSQRRSRHTTATMRMARGKEKRQKEEKKTSSFGLWLDSGEDHDIALAQVEEDVCCWRSWESSQTLTVCYRHRRITIWVVLTFLMSNGQRPTALIACMTEPTNEREFDFSQLNREEEKSESKHTPHKIDM